MLNYFTNNKLDNPIWLSPLEAAKLAGVSDKTIRRALKLENSLKFKIIKNRYQIELGSLVIFMHKNTKLLNKLNTFGLGQYWPQKKNKK